jgi:hypothetical protein
MDKLSRVTFSETNTLCEMHKNCQLVVVDKELNLPNGDIALLIDGVLTIKQTKQIYMYGCVCCEETFKSTYRLPIKLNTIYAMLQNL